jgi:hypothetical protein
MGEGRSPTSDLKGKLQLLIESWFRAPIRASATPSVAKAK